MLEPTYVADTVSRWTDLGVKLPKALAAAIEVYEALRYVEVDFPVTFDLSAVTANNAEAKIREFADQLAPTLRVVPTGGAPHSALVEAKHRALTLAARDVIRKASAAVPEAVKQLTPQFDGAAAEFTESVLTLPNPLTDSALVEAGPGALSDYRRAVNAQAVIAKHDAWLASLANLPGAGYERGQGTYVLTRLPKNAHRAECQLNPNYVAAAREGIEFGLGGRIDSVVKQAV